MADQGSPDPAWQRAQRLVARLDGSRRDLLALATLTLATLVLFATVSPAMGLHVDEGHYLLAGQRYADWLVRVVGDLLGGDPSALGGPVGDLTWQQNSEHPPLAKLVYGLCGWALQGGLGLLVAMRVGGLLFLLLAQFCLYWILSPSHGRLAGLLAGLAVLSQPRLLFHGFTCGLDLPAASLALLVTLAFLRGLERRWWAVGCGVTWGLALATKINGVFVAVPLWLWGFVRRRDRAVDNFFWMVVLAPLTLVAVWPWLWHNTLPRVLTYLEFHARHFANPVILFGEVYASAPWHFAPLMVLFTVPLPVLVAAVAALAWRPRTPLPEDRRWLLALVGGFALALVSLPAVPVFDGTRLFLLAPLALAGLAGVGAARAIDRLRALGPLPRRLVGATIGTALLLPGLLGTVTTQPYPQSYYNALIGYRSGARDAGMSPQSWAQVEPALLDWLHRRYPEGTPLYYNSGAASILRFYQELGLLHPGFTFVVDETAELWIIAENSNWSGFKGWHELARDANPVFARWTTFEHGGQKFLTVYRRRALPPADPGR